MKRVAIGALMLLLVSGCRPEQRAAWAYEGSSSAHDAAAEHDPPEDAEAEELAPLPPASLAPTGVPVACAGALFTSPTRNAADARSLIVSAITAAPQGAKLYMVMYLFDDAVVRDALLSAAARGVEIHVLLQAKPGNAFHRAAAASVAAAGPANEWVFAGRSHKPHAKFLAISTTGSCTGWVFASSYHPTGSALRKYQQSVYLSDQQLFDALVQYWAAIKADQRPKSLSTLSTDGAAKLIVFPRGREQGDYVEHVFDNVEPVNARIDVVMARWTKARIGLVDSLCRQALRGARVRILTRNLGDDGAVPEVLERLQRCSAVVNKSGSAGTLQVIALRKGALNVHAKYFLIEGIYGGDGNPKTQQRLVWSGSHNFTGAALVSNYEVLIKNHDAPTVDAFGAEFERVWQASFSAPRR